MLALLLALGTWQVQRLAWKNDLLARIGAAETGEPVPVPGVGEAPAYAKVIARGRLDPTREALLGAEVRGTTLGGHLLTPLIRGDGGPPILVDRGWVPYERSAASIVRPEGEVEVIGYVRPGEARGVFAAMDDAAGRRFYTFDPAAIGAALGLPTVAPYGLVALAPPGGAPPGVLPIPAQTLPRPNNPHLGYAITWYGLAAGLVAVFVAFVLRARQGDGRAIPPARGRAEDPAD